MDDKNPGMPKGQKGSPGKVGVQERSGPRNSVEKGIGGPGRYKGKTIGEAEETKLKGRSERIGEEVDGETMRED